MYIYIHIHIYIYTHTYIYIYNTHTVFVWDNQLTTEGALPDGWFMAD